MSSKREGGREAIVWLATAAVFFMGVIFCGFTILAFSNEPRKPILVMTGVFSGLAVVLFLLRDKPKKLIGEEEEKWFGLFRKPKLVTRYKPARTRKVKIVEFGTNEPPSAESIREIKELSDGMKNWSPPDTDPHHEPKS